MSDLDFLDDLDDAGGYIANTTFRRRHTFAPPVPIVGESGLSTAERKARERARRTTTPTTTRKLTEAWKEDGACRASNLNWFPDPHTDTSRQAALCATCPVRIRCLDYAIANHEHGYWAGTSERERNRIRRRRATA